MVSFLQLIELVVAGRLRNAEPASFKTVFRSYQNAQREYDYEYPFAHINLEAIGGHIVHWIHGTVRSVSLQAIDETQQWTLPGLFYEIREQLEYEHDLAARWYPVGKEVPIIVDPQFSSGVPTIVGRGVTVSTIHKRFKDGRLSDKYRDFQL